MNKKQILTGCLLVSLAATAIGGTLAYFTDNDQNTNEYTIGNVGIDLYETVKQTDGTDKEIIAEQELGKGSDDLVGIKYESILPGNEMTKIATVENTGNNDAYVALVIKQENYIDFNRNIDDYYEAMTAEEIAALGLEGTTVAEWMQEITDDVFPGWNLLYDKTQVAADNAQVRYTMDTLPASDDAGVKVLGVGYANYSYNDSEGGYYYNYSGKYFTNGLYINKGEVEGEPNFVTVDESGDGLHDRMWIVYLQLAPEAKFTIDLTTVCPAYFDNNSVNAFDGMVLDVKAFAIQSAGFDSTEDGQKAAFAEVLKADDCFMY